MTKDQAQKRSPDSATRLRLYRTMLEIRLFEERAREMFQAGKLPRHGHLYAGQEAVAAGVVSAIRDDDYIASTHRGHGHTIARTHDFKGAMSEIMGKEAGFCGGRGGTMHIADFDKAMLGSFPIVGASMPAAVGAALASKMRGDGRLAVAFFGDGAANQGTFHEAINLAAIWKLPVLFICENNQYALFSSQKSVMLPADIAARSGAYGIPGVTVDGMDAVAVYEAAHEAAARARAGLGPTLIEAKTYRWGGHFTADSGEAYRDPTEVEAWRQRDPIPGLRARLLKDGVLSVKAAEQMETEISGAIEEAIAAAFAAPLPDASQATAHIFAPEYRPPATALKEETRELTSVAALNEALAEEMEANPNLLIMGEDVRLAPFGVTKGLVDRFGPDRVINTPISENAFVGAAIGAALVGVPVVVEIMAIDFATLAMDPIVNVAAKACYMSAGRQHVPLVIRTQGGAGGGGAATHSQSLEAWFAHVPGLKVVLPATPHDYKGLLKTAIREPNPVIFIESKTLYRVKGPVPAGDYALPFGEAAIRRNGRDVTVVALGAMLPKALAAAETLAREGIEIEVIDPRTLVPLDVKTIVESVKRTGRLVVFSEAYKMCGFGAEIARVAASAAFDWLQAPIEVLGATAPIPFSPPLEDAVVPDESDLMHVVRGLAHRRRAS